MNVDNGWGRRMNMVTAAGMPSADGGLAGSLGTFGVERLETEEEALASVHRMYGGGLGALADTYGSLDPAEKTWVDDLVRTGVPLATALINLASGTTANPWGTTAINPATGLPYGAPSSGFGGMSIPLLILVGVGAFLLLGSGSGKRS
jgi:hypothetical protein